jgi:hypothetical protein
MYGGVFQNDEIVRGRFIARVNERYPASRVCFPKMSPELAAAEYAKYHFSRKRAGNQNKEGVLN